MIMPKEYMSLVPAAAEVSEHPVTFTDYTRSKESNEGNIKNGLQSAKDIATFLQQEMAVLNGDDNYARAAEALLSIATGWADCIICDCQTIFVVSSVAELLGVNMFCLLLADVLPRSDKFGLASDNVPPAFVTLYVHKMFQEAFACPPVVRKKMDEFRAKKGLRPIPPSWWELFFDFRTSYICHYSPTLFPPAPEWKVWGPNGGPLDNLCVTGDLQTHARGGGRVEELDTELLAFLQRSEAKPVYIGWGSIPVGGLLTEMGVRALKRLGTRGVVLTGTHRMQEHRVGLHQLDSTAADHAELVAWAGDNIRFVEACNHKILFPRCCAVVHHGGAGTTITGFKLGLPSVITPFVGDQWEHMRAAARHGVGPEMPAVHKLNVDVLANAIEAVTTDPAYKERAEALAAKLADEEPGTAVALRFVEKWVRRNPWADYWAFVDSGAPSNAPYRWWWPLAELLIHPKRDAARIAIAVALASLLVAVAWRMRERLTIIVPFALES